MKKENVVITTSMKSYITGSIDFGKDGIIFYNHESAELTFIPYNEVYRISPHIKK